MSGQTASETGPLPSDAVVIRGGKAINTGRARLNAMSVYGQTGLWGLCAAARPLMTADQLARRWSYTGEFYAATTIGAIRDLGPGFDVVSDAGEVHAIIVLPREPHRDHARDPLWGELQAAFVDPPIPNPNYSERR